MAAVPCPQDHPISSSEMDTGNPSSYKNLDQQMQGKKTSKESKEPMKVRYISSPVLVNAKNAAEFKAIVQELTGKDSSDEHHHNSPAAAGSRAHMSVPNQGPYNYGVTNAKLSHGVEQFQGSSTTESDQHEENVFWNFSESLSGCGFPYG